MPGSRHLALSLAADWATWDFVSEHALGICPTTKGEERWLGNLIFGKNSAVWSKR